MNYEIVAGDYNGVSVESLNNLEKYKDKTLEYVVVEPEFPPKVIFVFKDHTAYRASGLAVGYSGEGPHAFHKAIRMFSDKIAENFEDTAIAMLPKDKTWMWIPDRGFVHR